MYLLDDLTGAVAQGADLRFGRESNDRSMTVARRTFRLCAGTGEIIEPDDGLLAIGSGGSYALSAARALLKHSELEPEEIVQQSLEIAAKSVSIRITTS